MKVGTGVTFVFIITIEL